MDGASANGNPTPPAVVVVMGVSGSGKTTVASLLAGRLGWEFEDGDDFHPAANVEKMQAGTPLTDEDRWPWLDAIGAWLDAHAPGGGVATCSALKQAYRDRLLAGRPAVRLLHLSGDPALIGARQAARPDHFMPPSLMASQFATLEPCGADEAALVLDVAEPPETLAERAAAWVDGRTPRT